MNRLSVLITAARAVIPKPIVGDRPVVQANPVKARALRDALNDADQLAADIDLVLMSARDYLDPFDVWDDKAIALHDALDKLGG